MPVTDLGPRSPGAVKVSWAGVGVTPLLQAMLTVNFVPDATTPKVLFDTDRLPR